MSVTLITAFIDLAKHEANDKRRDANFYLQQGHFVLSLDVNLIMFVDPIHLDHCRQIRQDKGLLDKTTFITFSLTDSPYYKHKERITHNRKNNPIHNANATKDTADYIILTWTKFHFLQYAVDHNPYNSSHMIWMDFGITHVANTDHFEQDDMLHHIPDKIRLLCLKLWPHYEFENPQYYFSRLPGLTAAGIISGQVDNITTLCQHFNLEATFALQYRFGPSEQMILPTIINKHPDLFTLYYGDYNCILANYRHTRINIAHLNMCMNLYKEEKSFYNMCTLGQAILPDIKAKRVACNNNELLHFLDNFYLGAYWQHAPNFTLAKEVAQFIIDWYNEHEDFRRDVQATRLHLEQNFKHVLPEAELKPYDSH